MLATIKKVAFLATFFFINACGDVERRIEKAYSLARAHHFHIVSVQTALFPIQTFVKAANTSHAVLYFEGDGLVISQGHVAINPTPTDPVALRLAVVDTRPCTKIVINRPCQYLNNTRCEPLFWTQGRYSKDIIEAMVEAIKKSQAMYHFQTFEIVSYSGGAAVAFLVAPYFLPQITAIITFAGNVDPLAWTGFHEVAPLEQSLNPLDNLEVLRKIPQTHFVGTADDNTTLELTEQFQRKLNRDTIKIITVDGFAHDSDWQSIWKEFMKFE